MGVHRGGGSGAWAQPSPEPNQEGAENKLVFSNHVQFKYIKYDMKVSFFAYSKLKCTFFYNFSRSRRGYLLFHIRSISVPYVQCFIIPNEVEYINR